MVVPRLYLERVVGAVCSPPRREGQGRVGDGHRCGRGRPGCPVPIFDGGPGRSPEGVFRLGVCRVGVVERPVQHQSSGAVVRSRSGHPVRLGGLVVRQPRGQPMVRAMCDQHMSAGGSQFENRSDRRRRRESVHHCPVSLEPNVRGHVVGAAVDAVPRNGVRHQDAAASRGMKDRRGRRPPAALSLPRDRCLSVRRVPILQRHAARPDAMAT